MSSRLRRFLVRTTLLALLLGVSGVAAVIGRAEIPTNTKVNGINVDATTIPELQELMNSRKLSSVDLTNFYVKRIHQLSKELHAVITVSPTARADARAADQARGNGDDRPLLGIPIIVKDNVNTTGMPTTAGSFALAKSTPRDAFIAAQLKAAGRDHHRQGQPVRVGQLPVRPVVERLERHRRARRACRTSSIATRADRARAPAWRPPLISRSRPSARRLTARSSVRPAPTASSGSSRPSGCGAAQASSRSAPTRTRPARWPAT